MCSHRTVLVSFILVILSAFLQAQNLERKEFIAASGLTQEEVSTAISTGMRQRGRFEGLELNDVGQRFASMFATANTPGVSGYSVFMYTPLAWIKQQASKAAKEYRPFTEDDVTPEMVQPVLRIVVRPSTPTHVTGQGVALSSSVQHVVIRDAQRMHVVQPIAKEPFEEDVQNAFGAKVAYQGVTAIFPLDAVEELRRNNEEFFVTVIGQGGSDRDFKVKRKHFAQLPFGKASGTLDARVFNNKTPEQQHRSTVDSPKSSAGSESPKVISAAIVTISSEPTQAEVQIDNNSVGRAPLQIALSPGEHKVWITKEGFHSWQHTVVIKPGTVIPIAAVLEPVNTPKATNEDKKIQAAVAGRIATDAPGLQPSIASNNSLQMSGDGYLGAMAEGNRRVRRDGVTLSGVIRDSPADSAGIRPGDVIEKVEDTYIYSIEQLMQEIARHPPGSRIEIQYRRGMMSFYTYAILGRNLDSHSKSAQ